MQRYRIIGVVAGLFVMPAFGGAAERSGVGILGGGDEVAGLEVFGDIGELGALQDDDIAMFLGDRQTERAFEDVNAKRIIDVLLAQEQRPQGAFASETGQRSVQHGTQEGGGKAGGGLQRELHALLAQSSAHPLGRLRKRGAVPAVADSSESEYVPGTSEEETSEEESSSEDLSGDDESWDASSSDQSTRGKRKRRDEYQPRRAQAAAVGAAQQAQGGEGIAASLDRVKQVLKDKNLIACVWQPSRRKSDPQLLRRCRNEVAIIYERASRIQAHQTACAAFAILVGAYDQGAAVLSSRVLSEKRSRVRRALDLVGVKDENAQHASLVGSVRGLTVDQLFGNRDRLARIWAGSAVRKPGLKDLYIADALMQEYRLKKLSVQERGVLARLLMFDYPSESEQFRTVVRGILAVPDELPDHGRLELVLGNRKHLERVFGSGSRAPQRAALIDELVIRTQDKATLPLEIRTLINSACYLQELVDDDGERMLKRQNLVYRLREELGKR